jgi:hypothetical protein
MFAIIGMLVVLAAVIGGFLMEHGPIRVLVQPSELLIIAGAAAGTLLVANPLHTLKGIVSGVKLVLSGPKFNKQRYLDALKMMYDLFARIRCDGGGVGGERRRSPDGEQVLFQLSELSERSRNAELCLRHHASGNHGRGRAVRC